MTTTRVFEDHMNLSKEQMIDPKDPRNTRRNPVYDRMWRERLPERTPWHEFRTMIHACGRLQGQSWTNTEDALRYSLKKGQRFVEVDFKMTTDGYLVCSHGWARYDCQLVGMEWKKEFANMTRDLFMKQRILGMKTMDADVLYRYMKEYPDLHLELDFHQLDHVESVAYTRAFVRAMHGEAEVLDRCLLQVQTLEMLRGVREVYDFRWISFQVPFGKHLVFLDHLGEMIEMMKQERIFSVTVPTKLVRLYPELVPVLKQEGFYLILYSAASLSSARRAYYLGADCVCCDECWGKDEVLESRMKVVYEDTMESTEYWSSLIQREELNGEYSETGKLRRYTEEVSVRGEEPCHLKPCGFVREGYSFDGWEASGNNIHKEKVILCTDGLCYTEEEIGTMGLTRMRIGDGDILRQPPHIGRTIYLRAKWKPAAGISIRNQILKGDKIHNVTILYHSQRAAKEFVSPQIESGILKGQLRLTPKAAWELETKVLLGSDGEYILLGHPFHCEGMIQKGWQARKRQGDKVVWYTTDGEWLDTAEIDAKNKRRYLFRDSEMISGELFGDGRTVIVFEAVWQWKNLTDRIRARFTKK